MNILAVGDIVGTIGVKELQQRLPKIKKEWKIDFCIVNGENAAEGMGITENNFKDIINAGADRRVYDSGTSADERCVKDRVL